MLNVFGRQSLRYLRKNLFHNVPTSLRYLRKNFFGSSPIGCTQVPCRLLFVVYWCKIELLFPSRLTRRLYVLIRLFIYTGRFLLNRLLLMHCLNVRFKFFRINFKFRLIYCATHLGGFPGGIITKLYTRRSIILDRYLGGVCYLVVESYGFLGNETMRFIRVDA